MIFITYYMVYIDTIMIYYYDTYDIYYRYYLCTLVQYTMIYTIMIYIIDNILST